MLKWVNKIRKSVNKERRGDEGRGEGKEWGGGGVIKSMKCKQGEKLTK